MNKNIHLKRIRLTFSIMAIPLVMVYVKNVLAEPIPQATSEVVVNSPSNPVPVTVVGQGGVVSIANTPNVNVANSVQVSGTVNIGLVPYQHQEAIPDSKACAPQCQLPDFPIVPEGKRLVVTYVSAELQRAGTDAIILEGNGSTLFVTKPYENSRYISAAVTSYYESGQTPTARLFVEDEVSHTPLIVTISGYLVPSQSLQNRHRVSYKIHKTGSFH